ncbi:NSFL1 cofactor p47 [Histomonas meleagridis]|uniref:NSFL1 cofactor p47 n=1 Tax=Histomonas meleagridis TaxID=135588 RepID=UPI00355A7899|nr:NSFL1 cofactor p47 [Histomonas meleagridis]KAH0801562.1 NSFL1 cofactor p47 [Histomonas meleagridis]
MSDTDKQIWIAEFLQEPKGTQQIYLIQNGDDLEKAAIAYHNEKSKKYNTYYAGGSKSGVAVIAPGAEGAEEPPMKVQPVQKPAPSFTGTAHTLGSQTTQTQAQAQIKPVKTDYSTPGEPKTRIRLSFGNNQNLILSVNMSATIRDIKSYIIENVPSSAEKTITLVSLGKTLTDDAASVESAGLKMANINCMLS